MFTGIIESLGHLSAIGHKGGDCQLRIDAKQLDMSDVKLGDSIAVNGVCLTVTSYTDTGFSADVSNETLALSTLKTAVVGQPVNLEKALQLSSRLGGHMVSGHVDGIGTVRKIQSDGRAYRIQIEAPTELVRYMPKKGSITVDGTSLTINDIHEQFFELTIVPHTWQETLFVHYREGTHVNLEVDLVARYLEKLLGDTSSSEPKSKITSHFLADNGFY
ncbi:MAG: riboflavin synthase [Pseudomonadota bacterium]